MKFLLYSSPYQYYADNLIPLAEYLNELGHNVYGNYRLSESGKYYQMIKSKDLDWADQFLNGNIKVDCVILVQTWWYLDQLIAKYCLKKGIPLFVIEHATPMMRFTQKDGKKSHLYRENCFNAKNYFCYGKNNLNIMKDVGYNKKMTAVGSTRFEKIIKNIKEKKDGWVLFDTSNKMEDPKSVLLFEQFVKNNPKENFFIKTHSRSSGLYKPKFKNLFEINCNNEWESFEYSKFIFSFPSSAMIIPALLNKPIFSLYENHFCLEAREYHQKHKNIIPAIKLESNNVSYKEFLSNNIVYKENEKTEIRILKYILKEF